MKKQASFYKVGLGNQALKRASTIFLVLIVLLILASGSAVYAGFQTGQWQKIFVEPVKKLAKAMAESSSKPAASKDSIFTFTATSSANTSININIPTTTSIKSNNQRPHSTSPIYPASPTYPTPTPYSGKSLEQIQKDNQAWFEAQKQANDQWYKDQNAKNAQEAQDWFNQKSQEGAQWLEDWKKQNGF